MEIERQFLVNDLPPLPAECETIRQGYVALEPEIRIRQIGTAQYVLTVKRGAGLVRRDACQRFAQGWDDRAHRLARTRRIRV